MSSGAPCPATRATISRFSQCGSATCKATAASSQRAATMAGSRLSRSVGGKRAFTSAAPRQTGVSKMPRRRVSTARSAFCERSAGSSTIWRMTARPLWASGAQAERGTTRNRLAMVCSLPQAAAISRLASVALSPWKRETSARGTKDSVVNSPRRASLKRRLRERINLEKAFGSGVAGAAMGGTVDMKWVAGRQAQGQANRSAEAGAIGRWA